jgi:hypothetical protein
VVVPCHLCGVRRASALPPLVPPLELRRAHPAGGA